ncbi:MAG TPA: DUF1343 domain-containing protein [Streptosporangiaceae bacterium]
MTPGIEIFLRERAAAFRGARIALLAHAASVLPDLTHTLDALLAAGLNVVAVLGPEHGFRGAEQAGLSTTSYQDPVTGIPVLDAYARPMAEVLADVAPEVVLADVQHAGARFYTYEASLHDLISAAGAAGIGVLVADRPNPIGGVCVAGPVLEPEYASFVGRVPVPLRHGLTIGEFAQLVAQLRGAADVVEVIGMTGWRRGDEYPQTGLPWVPPSPNLPDQAALACYPGTCLMEGTRLSAGRGTTIPFQLVGAPWADERLAVRLRAIGLPGVAFRAASAIPQFDRYAGQPICGVQLHVTDSASFDPIRAALEIIAAALHLWPAEMTFREDHFDRLAGTAELRRALMAGAEPADIVAGWSAGLREFEAVRAGQLRYEEGDGSA